MYQFVCKIIFAYLHIELKKNNISIYKVLMCNQVGMNNIIKIIGMIIE